MQYLQEQRDIVLDAMRTSRDLLTSKREPWGFTIWARTAHDAQTLRDMMREPALEYAGELDGAVVLTIGLVESCRFDGDEPSVDAARWGVLVELRCGGSDDD